jgi:DNA-directed RNA polymerase specialized sigma54-like protein
MESLELEQAISVLQSNIMELSELVRALREDPILRAKTLNRLAEQVARLEMLRNSPRF